MPVTALYIELLISGLLVSIWLAMLCFRLGLIHPEHLAAISSAFQAFSTPTSIAVLSVPVLGILYLLGAYMNTASYRPFEFLIGNRLKKKHILSAATSNQHMIAVVYTECSGEVVRYIETHLMFMRMYRGSFFNFLFIGIQCIAFYPAYRNAGVFLVLLSAGCVHTYKEVAVLYYRAIREAFDLYKFDGPMRAKESAPAVIANESYRAPLKAPVVVAHVEKVQVSAGRSRQKGKNKRR